MGMNLLIQTPTYDDHPDWDDVRYAGDWEFIQETAHLQRVEHGEDYFRPVDFPVWREKALKVEAASQNRGRLIKLLDILESDPNYWVRVSY